ncbi:hypothetical protein GCM10023170_074600 [Phytohabitans houttuyneae]|uniref:Uncharacterized protein n=1 Tax=Phytohabitans houttuyneae TaxID=1076126 RepID=A0A6V8KJN7_9ACTN|nr:hypothetical protein Phou_078200 [Phytohabitans houttuyneae]
MRRTLPRRAYRGHTRRQHPGDRPKRGGDRHRGLWCEPRNGAAVGLSEHQNVAIAEEERPADGVRCGTVGGTDPT